MIISIASGKGGTGKTTVAANLASVLPVVQYVDCDAEEPNGHLFLKPKIRSRSEVTVLLPEINKLFCDSCRACADFCRYNALAVFPDEVLVFPEVCHFCGGCKIVCPKNAVSEKPLRIGTIEKGTFGLSAFSHGLLDVGKPVSIPIIQKLKKSIDPGGTVIIDAPPGTTCPMVETVADSDFTILVTEPTPFGLHDLKLAVEVMCAQAVPFGVVINRDGIGDDRVERYCAEEEIPVLMKIPFDRRIAESYSRGGLMVNDLPEYRDLFRRLFRTIQDLTAGQGRKAGRI